MLGAHMQIFDGVKLLISATTKTLHFVLSFSSLGNSKKIEVWPFFRIIFAHRDGTIFHFQLTVALATAVVILSK